MSLIHNSRKSNMQRVNYLLLPLIVCYAIGCNQQTRSGYDNIAPPTSENLAGRLEAAKLIVNVKEQDNALADLAKDAARAGDGNATKEAVKAISSTRIQDNAAAEAAVLLAKKGKSAEATEVAKLINQTSLCDETLARIAKGD